MKKVKVGRKVKATGRRSAMVTLKLKVANNEVKELLHFLRNIVSLNKLGMKFHIEL